MDGGEHDVRRLHPLRHAANELPHALDLVNGVGKSRVNNSKSVTGIYGEIYLPPIVYNGILKSV